MELLKNIIIRDSENSIFVYHLSNLRDSYEGDEEDTVTYIDKDKLQPELNEFLSIVEEQYIDMNASLQLIQYQNISQSFTGYERFWIIDNNDKSLEKKLFDLNANVQTKIELFGNKIVNVLKTL